MNLPGNKIKLLFIAALFLISCEDPGQIGIGGSVPNELNVKYVELPLESVVANIDSINTVGALLLGNYDDPEFGKVQATGYTGLSIYDLNLSVNESAIFDSCFLSLKVNYAIGPDLNSNIDINIMRLGDTLNRSKVYYSKDSIFTPRSIGQTLYNYGSDENSTLKVRMDDLGEKMFTDLKSNFEDYFSSQSNFRLYFRGFKFVVTSATQAIIGVDPTDTEDSRLTLYYHHTDSVGNNISGTYRFIIGSEPYWSEIRTDFSGTTFANLSAPYKDFDPNNGKAYSYPALGLIMKLDLKNLINFRDTVGNAVVNRADILFDLEGNTDTLGIQQKMFFYVTDTTNKFIISDLDKAPRSMQNEQFSISSPEGGAYPHTITFDADNNRYTDQITIYIQNILDQRIDDKYLLVLPNQPTPDYNSVYHPRIANMDHIIVDKSRLKLRLYYSKL